MTILAVGIGGALLAACSGSSAQPQSNTPGTALQCGTVRNQLAQSTDAATALRVEQCFAQAYQTCRPATLTFVSFGVDAGATHTFSIERSGSGCIVKDQVQSQVNTLVHDYTVTCATAAQQSDGLHLTGCGQFGEIVVAARGQE